MDEQAMLTMLRGRAPVDTLDVPVAHVVGRGAALRRRHRRGQLGTVAVGVAAAAVGVLGVVQLHSRADTARIQPATSPTTPFSFTVTADTAEESAQVPCAAVLHFAAGTTPSTTTLPCNDDYAAADSQLRAEIAHGDLPFTGSGEDPTLSPVSERDDQITLAGHTSQAVTGTAPAGTVAVIATDSTGRHLSATLVRVRFTPLVFWGLDTTSHKLTGVHYVLADGHHSIEEELSLP